MKKSKGNVMVRTLVLCGLLLTLFNLGVKAYSLLQSPSVGKSKDGRVSILESEYEHLVLQAKKNAPEVIEVEIESDDGLQVPSDMYLVLIQFKTVTGILEDKQVDQTRRSILCLMDSSDYISFKGGVKKSLSVKSIEGEKLSLDSKEFLYVTALDHKTLLPLK